MMITSALRARAAQRAGVSGSVDGIAMWAMTCLSAVLSASDANNFGTLLIRLTAPLVAAWGWERSMALERRLRGSRRARINWTITPERLLTRLGLADPDPERTASDADRQRRVIALALAVDDARAIRDSGGASTRQIRNAHQRLRRAMRHAIDSGGLIPFDGRDHREVLVDHIAALRSTTTLLDLDTPSPWPTVQVGHRLTPGAIEPSLAPDCASGPSPRKIPVAAANSADTTVTPILSRAHQREPVKPRPGIAQNCDAAGPQNNGAAPLARIVAQGGTTRSSDSAAPRPAADEWTDIAAKLCSEDPARRRDPETVREILRLWYDERRTYPQIAKLVDGYSRHAVGRVIRQARKVRQFRIRGAGVVTDDGRTIVTKRDREEMVELIGNLLAKAESRAGTPEGDLFEERAFQLLAKHGIDSARIKVGRTAADAVMREDYPVNGDFLHQQIMLLARIASGLHCAAAYWLHTPISATVEVYGAPRHLERVHLLYAPLRSRMLGHAAPRPGISAVPPRDP